MQDIKRTLPILKNSKPLAALHSYAILLKNHSVAEVKATEWFTVMDDSENILEYRFMKDKVLILALASEDVKCIANSDEVNTKKLFKSLKEPPINWDVTEPKVTTEEVPS